MDGNQSPQGPELPQVVQPGQTVSPGGQTPSSQPVATPVIAAAEMAQPTPPEPVESPVTTPEPTPPLPEYNVPETDEPVRGRDEAPGFLPTAPVSWTASEFIAHEKSVNWYVLLFGGAIIAAGLVWLITKDAVSAVVIIMAVGVLAAYSSRKPRELQYTLDDEGITIGEKHYPYTNFRSYAVAEEGAFSSIELMPLKRFSPPISIYYDPAHEAAITAALTPHLPFQPHKPDAIDQLVRRIRF